MPPAKKRRPDTVERQRLENWIKFEAFGIDPRNIDPGRVTVRRLNRVEYRNTIRDLLGVDFDAESQFPPDDTGYGFDNIGDVLNSVNVSVSLVDQMLRSSSSKANNLAKLADILAEKLDRGDEAADELVPHARVVVGAHRSLERQPRDACRFPDRDPSDNVWPRPAAVRRLSA